jgi:hypothetical protein
MKKILLIVALLLGLAGAGAGYYLFVMKPEQDAKLASAKKAPDQPEPLRTREGSGLIVIEQEKFVSDYYVNDDKVAIRNQPDDKQFAERWVYKGDHLKLLEMRDGWGRVSNYYVVNEGEPEIAEWVSMSALSLQQPVITRQERDETLSGYIFKSDDFKIYRDIFIKVTDQLLMNKSCEPEDFDELQGWVKSTKFSNRNVYFIYCGGLKIQNKIYLDANSGEIFYQ